jgi:hypothetical protein
MRPRALDDRIRDLEAAIALRQWRAAIVDALPERHRSRVDKALASVPAGGGISALLAAMLAAVPAGFRLALATVHRDAAEAETGETYLRAMLRAAGEQEATASSKPVRRAGPSNDDQFHAWVDAQLDLLARDPATFWRWQHG